MFTSGNDILYDIFCVTKMNAYVNFLVKRRRFLRNGGFILGATLISNSIYNEKREYLAYVGAGIRFLRSLRIGMEISIDYYVSKLGLEENSENYKVMMSRVHRRSAERILNACLTNGGTYIKLGQGLVSLSHILPEEYIVTLAQLQDKCLERERGEMVEMMQEDFGKHPEELFREINMEPIAAASLAQVFHGVTADGQEVAIKVQYNDLQRRFVSDVATIDFLLKIIGLMHPDFNFGWVLQDLSERLKYELDFENEARNSERCARDLSRFSFIYVPKVRWDLTTKRILVTEFIRGVKINDVDGIRNLGVSLKDIDSKLIESFGYQIFQVGFVHADPHPGNVLIRKVGRKTQIVLLDHGLYQSLDENTRTSLSHMWRAIVLQNFEKMKKYSAELKVEDPETFAEILTQRPVRGFKLSMKMTREEMDYMTKQAQERFDRIMKVLRDMPRSLLLVVRNLNTIRSIIHDHGEPVDRYAILARCATKESFQKGGFLTKILLIPIKLWFEFKLFTSKLWVLTIKKTTKLMHYFGRSPDLTLLVAELQ